MTGGKAERDETTDGSGPAHHPLVATRALLQGRVAPLPGPFAERRPNGRLPRFALNAMLHVAEALFSVHGTPPPQERMAWLAVELDDFMARASGVGRLQFAVASGLVTLLAPLRIGRLPGLGRLTIRDRVYALERFEETLAAPLLIALRAILCLLYYEHPDAAREVGIGVDGPVGAKLLGEGEGG